MSLDAQNDSEPRDYSSRGDEAPDLETLIPLTCNTPDQEIFANVRSCLARGLPSIWFQEEHERVAVLVGGGPSMAGLVPEIALRKQNGHEIFALNGAGAFLRDQGVIPDYVVTMDARAFNVRFVQSHDPSTKFLLGSQCHPGVFDAVEGRDVMVWHSNYNGKSGIEVPGQVVKIGGGSSGGMRLLNVLRVMGYRDFHLYGFDSCYAGAVKHAYEQAENEGDVAAESIRVEGDDREFVGATWMIRQAIDFAQLAPQYVEQGCRISVHGSGLIKAIADQLAKPREPLERGQKPSTLTFFYDLHCSPASYDFLGVLAAAEQERIKAGLERLKVVIAPGPNGGFRSDTIAPLDPVQRRKMLQNIVIDGCSLLPSVESIAFCGTRDEAAAHERDASDTYPPRYFVDYPNPSHGFMQDLKAMVGGPMDHFEAPDWARARVRGDIDPRTISITFRETHYGSLRNSQKPEWFKAARELQALGHKIVVVRDSDTMGGYVSDLRAYDPAAESIAVRLALYERCAVNLFVPNGPCMIAWCSRLAKSITFRMLNPEYPGMSDAAWYAKGFPPDSQFPGTVADRHRLIWEPDVANVIVRETLAFLNA